MKGFARFIRKNLIALPIFEEDKTVFSLNLSKFRLLFYNTNYTEDSWVAFDRGNNVVVSISPKDYQQYKDVYAFDQVCTNLGKLFIEFLEDYKKDQALNIIDKLDRK